MVLLCYNFEKNTKYELLFCTFSALCDIIVVVQIFIKTMLFSDIVSRWF